MTTAANTVTGHDVSVLYVEGYLPRSEWVYLIDHVEGRWAGHRDLLSTCGLSQDHPAMSADPGDRWAYSGSVFELVGRFRVVGTWQGYGEAPVTVLEDGPG